MRIHCGTSNPGKLREFQQAAPDFEIVPVSLATPEETGKTFEENALLRRPSITAHTWTDICSSTIRGSKWMRSAVGRVYDSAHFDKRLAAGAITRRRKSGSPICLCDRAGTRRPGSAIVSWRSRGPCASQAAAGRTDSDTIRCFTTSPSAALLARLETSAKMRVSHRAQALEKMFTFLRSAST